MRLYLTRVPLEKMLLGRNFEKISENDPVLTVFHWNVLSDQLSGFFPSVEDRVVEWEFRKEKIRQELGGCDADLVCLSEVDHYLDFFHPVLQEIGYSIVYKKKKGWHRDGLCICFRRDRFRLLFQHYIYFPGSNQLAIVVKLQLGTIEILVVSTHLKSGAKYENDRKVQIKYLLMRLKNYGNIPMIMCGDFNCEPHSLTYTEILTSSLKFSSAYYSKSSKEPELTTYKKREEIECKTIDYIFTKGFEVTSILKLPSLTEIEKKGLPSEDYPSDHLSLSCKLAFTYKYSL